MLPEGEDLNEWLAVNSTPLPFLNSYSFHFFLHSMHSMHSIYRHSSLMYWHGVAVDFVNQINLLYGSITEFCIPSECTVMNAGPKYEYHWSDGVQFKKPVKVSAPEYIDYLMTWIQNQLDDESIFPSKIGTPPPTSFSILLIQLILFIPYSSYSCCCCRYCYCYCCRC